MGGEEAEYVQVKADQLGTISIAGGASFGAPGVPQLASSDPNNNFTRYYNSGDIVGNLNSGTATVGQPHPFNNGDAAVEVALFAAGALGMAAQQD